MFQNKDVPALNSEVQRLEQTIDTDYPSLIHQLTPILQEVRHHCGSTDDALHYARAIVKLLKRYVNQAEESQKVGKKTGVVGRMGPLAQEHDSSQCPPELVQELQGLIASRAGELRY